MSAALRALETGVEEVGHLLSADPAPRGALSPAPEVTRAVIRAAVVILSSHFERYVRAISEEAVSAVNERGVDPRNLTEELRLQHSRIGIELLVSQQWDRRSASLARFVESDGWLWSSAPVTELDAGRLLTWMKSPKPDMIVRAFNLWGIPNIFARITRKGHTRAQFYFRLTELVEKRNKIAHGEFRIEATRADVEAYQDAVLVFCRRADVVLERALKRIGIEDAWRDSA